MRDSETDSAEMPNDYDDSDLTEEERFLQRTVMKNLLYTGFKPLKMRKSTYKRHGSETQDF
jgi:hypothetical protein